MTELFLLSTGQDTGGFGWRIREAYRHADTEGWVVRSMAATRTYIQYPEDQRWHRERCLSYYAAADVVHLQNQTAGHRLYDDGAGKPTILQHHGTIFREGHERLSAEAREVGMVEICSTLDLTLLEPAVEWVPVPYNLDELAQIRARYYRPSDKLVVAHAPTNRKVKGTDHFVAVMAELARELGVRLELIEYRSWAECLRRKARADVFYDQLELGYGCNAVEAWGMGLPVVAGVADPTVRQLMLERWGRLPFAEATPETLHDVLRRLLTSRQAREEYAQLGREHVLRWHDEPVVVPWLQQIYSSAPATEPGPLRERAARRHGSESDREARRRERARRQERALERALARRAAHRAERREADRGAA